MNPFQKAAIVLVHFFVEHELHGNSLYGGAFLAFAMGELNSVQVGNAQAAVDEFERLTGDGKGAAEAIRAASIVARQKTEDIKPWVAKRGRASYTGERSCGTYDAGSVAVAMMAEQLAAVWEQQSTVA